MEEMSNCLVCHGEVDWQKVIAVSNVTATLDKADHFGVDALSEFGQLLYSGLLCENHTDRNVVELERDAEAVNLYLAWAVCKPHATYLYGIGVTAGACPVCKEINRGTH